jgi:hypothetical protein
MRVAYKVKIQAEDQNGNKVEFIEIVNYPDFIEFPDYGWNRHGQRRSIPEFEREEKAISQVRYRMAWLKNIRAHGSIFDSH